MLKHFYLTRRQWFGILKWTVYALLFLLAVVFQSVILSRLPLFGFRLNAIPILLVCVCLREGPEKGGLFVLLASTFWALSGIDMGNLWLLTVTLCAVFSAILCRTVLSDRIVSAAVCCFVSLLLCESLVFVFKLILTEIDPANYLRVLLPSAALSMLTFLPSYLLVKAIAKIGGDHGV